MSVERPDRWTMSVRGGLILKWIELSECFEQNIYLGTFQAPDRFHRFQCFRCHDGYMTQPVPQSRADWNVFPIFCHGFARYHNGSLKAGETMDMMASNRVSGGYEWCLQRITLNLLLNYSINHKKSFTMILFKLCLNESKQLTVVWTVWYRTEQKFSELFDFLIDNRK